MTYRVTQSTGGSLGGYVNWTLSSFPIADYNRIGTIPSGVPPNLTYCRYRDFRESTGPSYSETLMFWNVTAARLAFIVVFQNLILFVIYLLEWLIPDVPQSVKERIERERYIDQQGRWANKSLATFGSAARTVEAAFKLAKRPDEESGRLSKDNTIIKSAMKTNGTPSSLRRNARRRRVLPQ